MHYWDDSPCPQDFPPEFLDFVQETILFDDTILYNHDKISGICHHCRAKIRTDRMTPHGWTICPNCDTRCTCAPKYGKSTRKHIINRCCLMTRDGDNLWIREFDILRDPDAQYPADITAHFVELACWLIRGHTAQMWIKTGERWQRHKRVFGSYGVLFVAADLAGTALEYHDGTLTVSGALDFARSPGMECLQKAGYTQLAKHAGNTQLFRGKQTNIGAIFKFPKRFLRWKPPAEWTQADVRKLNILWQGRQLDTDEPGDWGEYGHWRNADNLRMAFEFSAEPKNLVSILFDTSGDLPISRTLRYLQAQATNTPGETAQSMLGIYTDYLQASRLTGMTRDASLRRKIDGLYPKNLKQTHDRQVAEAKARRDAQTRKEREEAERADRERWDAWINANREHLTRLATETDTLTIAPILSLDDLRKEGDALHHCVYAYKGDIIAGKCKIFAIRDKNAPKTPFYTLELRGKTISQCRTKYNKPYTIDPDVKNFVKKWAREHKLKIAS